MLKCVITDVDGTLYNHKPVKLFMFYELAKHPIQALQVLNFRAKRLSGQLIKPSNIVENWMLYKPLKYMYRYRNRKLIKTLNRLHNKGVKIIAYSDYPCTEKLLNLGLIYDKAYCADDLNIRCFKPDKRGLYNILKENELNPLDCLFIGNDLRRDKICALRNNIDYLHIVSTLVKQSSPTLKQVLGYHK